MKIQNVAAILAAVALSASVFAQGPMGGPPGGRRGGGMGMMGGGRRSPQEQADMMTKMMSDQLKLTPAQATKVKAIILKAAIETKKIRDAQQAAIKKVLTPAQQAQMASMGRGPGMGGPGGRPPMGRP